MTNSDPSLASSGVVSSPGRQGVLASVLRQRQLWVAAALVLGTAARVHGIGYSLNTDEIFSVRASSSSLSYLVEAVIADRIHPPLYLLLLHFWMQGVGTSEVAIRLLSVAASVGFLFFVSGVAFRIAQGWAALFVVLFCALSGALVYYTQEARPYPFVALFGAMSIWSLLNTQKVASGWRHHVLYGVACAGLMYSQYMGALFLLAQFGVVLLAPFQYKRRLLLCGFLGALSVLPWLAFVAAKTSLTPTAIQGNLAWIDRPTWLNAWQLVVPVFGWMPVARATLLLTALLLLTLAPLLVQHRRVEWSTGRLIAAGALFPPAVAFLVSAYGPVSVWALRQLIPSVLMIVCLLGLGLTLHRPVLRAGLGGTLLAWAVVFGLPAWARHNVDWPTKDIARVLTEMCPGCTVIVPDLPAAVNVAFYSHQPVRPFERQWTVAQLPNLPYSLPGYRDQDQELAQDESGQLLVLCGTAVCKALHALRSRYHPVAHREIAWGIEPWQRRVVWLLGRRALHE